MYDALSTRELAVLQDILYAATEKTYRLADLGRDYDSWFSDYQHVHRELARLFLEAAEELLGRLDNQHITRVA